MAFNWGGAAAGVNDVLQQQIKNDLERAQLNEQVNYRKLQTDIAKQNADSLKEERDARVAERDLKVRAREQRIKWAQAVSEGQLDPNDPMAGFHKARASYILSSGGEDLPDTAVANYLKPEPKRTPSLLTKEEEEQQKRLIAARAAATRANRPPSAAAALREERRKSDLAVQNYLGYLKRKHTDPKAALNEFDTAGDVLRKGGGLVDVGNYRRLLERMYGLPSTPYTPEQEYKNRVFSDMLRDEEAAAAAAQDEETGG
jgi:hypothetical protein